MSLKVTYEITCDFCKESIGGIDMYELAPFVPVSEPRLPFPRIQGHGFGDYIACENCLFVARQSLMSKTKNQEVK